MIVTQLDSLVMPADTLTAVKTDSTKIEKQDEQNEEKRTRWSKRGKK